MPPLDFVESHHRRENKGNKRRNRKRELLIGRVIMAELTQNEVAYSPKTMQVWKALLNWLGFFFQIFVQIVSSLGHHPLLSSSSSSSSSSDASFKSLPAVELQEHDSSAAVSAVEIDTPDSDSDDPPQKLTVVLDLDETLICAYESASLPGIVRTQATEGGLKWFELECFSSDKECDGKPKVNYVTVFERPGLHEFLKQVHGFADLVLFTAGLEGYARPLVDRIDVENLFSFRLYRPSTTSTEYREHVKDLSGLSKDMGRIVIVDNNPFSFMLQPLNGIPCIPFSAGQIHDTQLLDVLLPLLKHLSLQKDVRPVLYERFHMPEWFQKQGIPSTSWK
ncbi:CTD nuclear envelope phosphatase 1 homolog isoform X3 [Rosa chinensis]|nr:CTD nuclear envelope phosphatase 1 homolog isoform X3 [Rosa chinensis]